MEQLDWKDQEYLDFITNLAGNVKHKEEWFSSEIIIKAGGQTMVGHSIILCAVSSYFRAMKSAGLKESQENIITFPDLNPKALLEIINFTCTGEIKINKSNIFEIMRTTDYICIGVLKPVVTHFLLDTLSADNCLEALAYSSLYGYTDIVPDIFNFIFTNYTDVSNNQSFLEAPSYIIEKVTCDHSLSFSDAFQALSKWLHHKINCGIKTNMDNYKCIEFYLEYLCTRNAEDTELTELLKRFTKFACEKQLEIEDKGNHSNRTQTQSEAIFCIGGESNKKFFANIECNTEEGWSMMLPFLPNTNVMVYVELIIPQMRERRAYFGCALHDQYVYVIGGANELITHDSCEIYDIGMNKWTEMCPLPSERCGVAAAFLNHVLYVSGGAMKRPFHLFPYTDVLKYNDKEKSWKKGPPMQHGRAFHTMCNVRGTLYVVGGESMNMPVRTVEKYNEDLEKWVRVTILPEEISDFGSCSYMEFIYIFGGWRHGGVSRSVYRYNTWLNKWERRADMPVCKYDLSCVVKKGRIYCIGGCDKVHGSLPSTEIYNPRTDRWQHSAYRLQIPRHSAAAVLIKLH